MFGSLCQGFQINRYAFDIATTYFQSPLGCWRPYFPLWPGFVHAKVYVSDSQQAVVGTINTDYRSLYQNFEDGVYLYKNWKCLTLNKILREPSLSRRK